MKKTLAVVLAFVLVIAMSVAGTFAYLTAKTDAVTNTFTVGGLVGEGGLVLKESEAKPSTTGVYELDTLKPVNSNSYTFVPGVNVPKDPYVTVTFKENPVDAYLFVEVVDGITDKDVLGFGVNDKWNKLEGVTGTNGGQIYTLAAGKFHENLNKTYILTDNQITVKDFAESKEFGENNLKFYAYLCQAGNFDTAQAAWEATFAAKP